MPEVESPKTKKKAGAEGEGGGEEEPGNEGLRGRRSHGGRRQRLTKETVGCRRVGGGGGGAGRMWQGVVRREENLVRAIEMGEEAGSVGLIFNGVNF